MGDECEIDPIGKRSMINRGRIRRQDQTCGSQTYLKVEAWSGDEWITLGHGQETWLLAQSSSWVSQQLDCLTVARLAKYEDA